VQFATPMNKQPRIAILGGGMSGLVCALTLEELGISSTVFDTGKHGLGGRMATRDIETREGQSLVFDHAAQYFTVSDPRFHKLVDRWIKEGAVKEWTGVVGTLRNGGQFEELIDGPRYVGVHGMRPLADHMVSQGRLIEVRRPIWISHISARGNSWQLSENGQSEGTFDAVVIAHNGKCANRLLAPSGAPLVFKQMKRLELSSIWALMAAFDEPLPSPLGLDSRALDGAFVEGVNAISWMGNNTSKLPLSKDRAPHCWTFFSTAAFGKKNKVPQESIPVLKSEKVKREMLQGAELALGLPEGSMPVPFYVRPQLWGAALPVNTPGVPCIFDAHARVGICGDWLLGSSLEAAALSGMALAHHIAEYRDRGDLNPEEFSIGLDTGFSNVEGQDIGQFPGSSCSQASSKPELVASAH
jgi:predicted NAD/FAD-dependent oxidoreductase